MDVWKVLLILAVTCLTLSAVEAKRKPGKKKPHKATKHKHEHFQHSSKVNEQQLENLVQSVEKLQNKVNELASHSGGNGSASYVHIHFHGDEDDHGHAHEGDGHTHVDVHLHMHDDHHEEDDDHEDHHHGHGRRGRRGQPAVAHCEMTNSKISGYVDIVHEENESHANFYAEFAHLGAANEDFAMHVHEFGDMSDGCKSLGGHYNPQNERMTKSERGHKGHGKTDLPSDLGDLGVVQTDSDGAVEGTWKNDTHLCLIGRHSVLGRSIIVHDTDGSHLGCCVIGLAPSEDDTNGDDGHSH